MHPLFNILPAALLLTMAWTVATVALEDYRSNTPINRSDVAVLLAAITAAVISLWPVLAWAMGWSA